MVAPVQKDSLTDYQVALTTILRISSPVSGMFTGSDIKINPNTRSIMVPDIRVDDYIVDADIARIGADHYSGSEFTDEWKNGIPPIEWRRYSMSRHRSFGFTVFDEQLRYSPIKNLPQEYTTRKMQTTVLRDHDKYCLFAAISGHMTGKLVARTASDAVPPYNADAARISHTGDARDYKWIAEPGEDYDNEIQPSFATIKGMVLDETNPLATVDQLTLTFSDNWFDSNFGNSERFLLVTSALELAFINYLIKEGTGTESAFRLLKDGDISGANAAGYLGTLKGSWKLQKIHPEFLPRVFTDSTFVVDPVATTETGSRTLRQVVGLAAYKNAIQVYDHFAERRQEDGGTRFKGTEYVQDFSYDAWVIDQLSEGVVPLFLKDATISGDQITYSGAYTETKDSFNDVATAVAAARTQLSVAPVTYPMTGADVLPTRPEWFNQPYGQNAHLNAGLSIQETGDVAHTHPTGPAAYDSLTELNEELTAQLGLLADISLAAATARGDADTVAEGEYYKYATPASLWVVTTGGTTDTGQPDISGSAVGETVTDGTAELQRVL